MFIPPTSLKNKFAPTTKTNSKVRLKSSHLLIDRSVAKEVFGSTYNVNVVYYSDRRTLMIAAVEDDLFKQLHKTKQHLLKDRNLLGDKTIALHELLIDNQVNATDRDLDYELQAGLGILNVKL